MKVVDLATEYKVDSSDVRLSIIIGDAQIGSSVVTLDQEEIGRGDIQNLSLGNGQDLKNKAVNIKSVVTDVNDLTNHTSITYQLEGGAMDQSFRSAAIVDQAGDSVIYRAKFTFV